MSIRLDASNQYTWNKLNKRFEGNTMGRHFDSYTEHAPLFFFSHKFTLSII